MSPLQRNLIAGALILVMAGGAPAPLRAGSGQSTVAAAGEQGRQQSGSADKEEFLDSTQDDTDYNKAANTSGSFKAKTVDDLKSSQQGTTPAAASTTPASSGSATTPASSGSITDPFGALKGQTPADANAGGGENGQVANVPIPAKRPDNINIPAGTTDVSSLREDREKAWALLRKGMKERDKALIEEARDMYEKLVFATNHKNGNFLYYFGRCNEELYRLTKDKGQAKKANELYREAAQRLRQEPDKTRAVSANDAESRIDNVETEQSGGFGGLKPVSHRITSQFGMRTHPVTGKRKMHKGIDFGCPIGTPVKAIGDGKIVKSGWENGYGKVVIVEHNVGGKKLFTRYAHLSKTAPVGTRVSRGQDIPGVKTGNTGIGTGPHLHFEVRSGGPFGEAINPARYFGVLSNN